MSEEPTTTRTEQALGDLAACSRKCRFIVTGAGGWLGRCSLEWLAQQLGEDWRDRVQGFASSAREITVAGSPFALRPLTTLEPEEARNAIVLHFAFLGMERSAEAGFLEANLAIDTAVLSAARNARAVFASSSGMARQVADGASSNPYGVAKLVQEARFLAFGESGPRVMVGRVFNVAGPHMNKANYALASFIERALAAGEIAVDAPHPVFRSYLHVYDLIELVTRELLAVAPPPLTPIDLCGAQVVEMQQVAEAVAEAMGVHPTRVRRTPVTFATRNAYVGDPRTTLELALRHDRRLIDFKDQVRDTVAWRLDQSRNARV